MYNGNLTLTDIIKIKLLPQNNSVLNKSRAYYTQALISLTEL